ncbi:hypothetical protein AAG570_004630 [Ranatra chinensis]|uniref:Uncharacterized protein n=1 Tax=Ranatra chinensis TaxID=642074 RepID=A0ABD0YJK8_9HEMI
MFYENKKQQTLRHYHEKEMAALREEIRKEKEECRKLYRDIAQDGYYIHKIRLAMVHFNKMLDGVSPAGPGPEFEELGINVEELPTFVDALEPHKGTEEEFLRVARQDIPRDYEETDQLGEEPLDDMLYDVDLTHLVDNVQLKVMMLMKQVGDLQLTEEEMKEAEQLYERRVVESLKPMRKPKKIVPLPAEKGFRGKKIPTRIELKNASRRFADEHETRPPPPDPHEKLAKHDCI